MLGLHKPDAFDDRQHLGYLVESGILKEEAVTLLRSFYNRENFHAPDDKRKRKS
jgi:tRNA-specific adenosine deaminase 2